MHPNQGSESLATVLAPAARVEWELKVPDPKGSSVKETVGSPEESQRDWPLEVATSPGTPAKEKEKQVAPLKVE